MNWTRNVKRAYICRTCHRITLMFNDLTGKPLSQCTKCYNKETGKTHKINIEDPLR